jgi:uncharacterized repeat protein (TIGR03803 family)
MSMQFEVVKCLMGCANLWLGAIGHRVAGDGRNQLHGATGSGGNDMRIMDRLSRLAPTVGLAIAVATGATAGGYHVEYAFGGGADGAGPASSLLEYQQKLYGTTDLYQLFDSKMYVIDPKTGAETVINTVPQSVGSNGLINFGGELYGTTFYGSGSYGAIYALDPATGQLKIAYAFKGGADGCYPAGDLIKFGGLLYGMTQGCGHPEQGDAGTVYSFDPKTGVETVVYAFKGLPDGSFPRGDLTVVGGALYGTTNNGGESNACFLGCGTVFKVDPLTGAETVLHSFAGASDGALPNGGLTKIDGLFYGITSAGGLSEKCIDENFGCGVIFSLNPSNGDERALYIFKNGSDGAGPAGRMTKVGTSLYGVTEFGGAHNDGTVFAFDFRKGVKTIIHAFGGGSDGVFPGASLTYSHDRLFGTTIAGGAANDGTVFSIRP